MDRDTIISFIDICLKLGKILKLKLCNILPELDDKQKYVVFLQLDRKSFYNNSLALALRREFSESPVPILEIVRFPIQLPRG